MPSVKRTGVKSAEVKTGFESYDGEEPKRRGMYRARISILQFKQFRTGSQGFKVQVILEAQKGDPKGHKQFDGYPSFANIVFGDKEALITRENNFYAALGLKDEPVIVYDDKGDLEDGIDVKTLGGKSLAALKKVYVNVDLKPRRDGQDGMEIDGIYKLKEVATSGAGKPEAEEEDADLLEEEGEDDEETGDEARAEELAEASLPDLRALAKEYGIKTVGLKKDAIIEAILAYEAELPEDEEEPEDEEADEEEPDDEPEEDEEEDEEEADDDERAARSEELSGLNRIQLKTVLKGHQPDFVVLKRHTEADLIELILVEEFGADGETPF